MTQAATADLTDARHRRVPGQWAMWVFVLGDMFIFAGWFMFYMANRAREPLLFLESQRELNQALGVINTLVLLTSSLFIALCVHAARYGHYKKARAYTILALVSGIIFFASKVYEWTTKIGAGITFNTNDFFTYYFFLTAIHSFHVLVGFIVLGVVIREVSSPAFRSQEVVETGATYWHMVDLLWVIIFALLYLLR
jgi:nitric oxide reductase NorE protein